MALHLAPGTVDLLHHIYDAIVPAPAPLQGTAFGRDLQSMDDPSSRPQQNILEPIRGL